MRESSDCSSSYHPFMLWLLWRRGVWGKELVAVSTKTVSSRKHRPAVPTKLTKRHKRSKAKELFSLEIPPHVWKRAPFQWRLEGGAILNGVHAPLLIEPGDAVIFWDAAPRDLAMTFNCMCTQRPCILHRPPDYPGCFLLSRESSQKLDSGTFLLRPSEVVL